MDFRHTGREVEKGEVGLYIGYHTQPWTLEDGQDVFQHLLAVRHSDYWLFSPELTREREKQGVLPTDVLYLSPGLASKYPLPIPQTSQYARYIHPPAHAFPTPWRHLQMEVSSKGVIISWADDADQHDENLLPLNLKEVLRIPENQIQEKTRSRNSSLAKSFPDRALQLPPWQPRRAMGLFVKNTSASYRNVYIEPLRD
jgi:hypothetical protein